jgi:hypothetical protein
MAVSPLKVRLDKVARKGALSTADLALWFGLSYQTVRSWRKGVSPYQTRVPQIEERLEMLEKAVNSDSRLPVPLKIWKQDREKYLRDILAYHSRS